MKRVSFLGEHLFGTLAFTKRREAVEVVVVVNEKEVDEAVRLIGCQATVSVAGEKAADQMNCH